MIKYIPACALLLLLVVYTSCTGLGKPHARENTRKDSTAPGSFKGPETITRNIIQDRKGNIWMAAFDGIFRYDGKAFTQVTAGVSQARFFSLLEDRKGNFWFGSVGSGVYYYDGKDFKNFTTKDGLLNNEVTSIYEDKKGNIWFGTSGGASRYDGNSFRNYITNGTSLTEDRTGKTFTGRQMHGVGPVTEDRKGNLWFGTGGVTVYNGKTFTPFMHNGQPFKNVRSIIKDSKGNIWLGGADGLWRYDGKKFTHFTERFVGHIMEDSKGNIWTSSGKNIYQDWALSRYDGKTLLDKNPVVKEIANKPMTFGILEAKDGSIWFGSFGGVFRYDGKTLTDFKGAKEEKKANVF